jgi:hypothetical protein
VSTYNVPRSLEARLSSLERSFADEQRRSAPYPYFRDLADADLAQIADGQVPVYDSATGRYIPGNAGGGGGAQVYCGTSQVELDSGMEAQLATNVEFVLTATSTVAIHISFGFNDDPASMGVPSSAFAWSLDGDAVITPALRVSNPTIHTAATLDAGTHDVDAAVTTSLLNLVVGTCTIVVIVGSDTGDHCVAVA